jgi:ribose transport system ATP-binding protein
LGVATRTPADARMTSPASKAAGTTAPAPLVQLDHLSKRYGGIQALDDVSLDLQPGSVHALVGANGAGKSTLVRILAGIERQDAGAVLMDGVPAHITGPQDATKLGLSFIHQELNLVPKFTVLQNLAMNFDDHRRLGMVSWRRASVRAEVVMDSLGADFGLDREVSGLTVSQRWTVSLGRSLMRDARMVAMDEPTASFAAEEAERLFSIVRDLVARGVSVLYISHRLDEVLDLSTDITVLRNGKLAGTHRAADTSRRELTRSIVGRHVEAVVRHEAPPGVPSESVLVLEDVSAGPRVRGVSLQVKRGEILGLAGLVGAGRTELARLIFGADVLSSGSMTLAGSPYAPRSPYDAIRRGVALVPEERRSQGLLLKESLSFNINLATMRRNRSHARIPLLSTAKARRVAQDLVKSLSIKAGAVSDRVASLSGGNQQKVVVGRFMRTEPVLLILDEPTVGVDVGARAEIYELIRQRADAGTAVVMISSDFEEFGICDRVAVMREGRIETVIAGERASKEALTALCYVVGAEAS